MSPLMDFSTLDRWYRAEVHGEDFQCDKYTAQEAHGKYARFDVDGCRRDSPEEMDAIGAEWHPEDSYVGDEFIHVNSLLLKVGGGDDWFSETGFFDPTKLKHANLSKPLPPVPDFENGRTNAHDLPKNGPIIGPKSAVAARIDVVPFDGLLANATELELIAGHGDDRNFLVPTEVVEDDCDTVTGHSRPTSPHELVQYHEVQSSCAAHGRDLADIKDSIAPPQASVVAGIVAATTELDKKQILPKGTDFTSPHHSHGGLESEEDQATELFFNGSVEESPDSYHVPLLQDEKGHGDIREGCEHILEHWPKLKPDSTFAALGRTDSVYSSSVTDAPGNLASISDGATAEFQSGDGHALGDLTGLVNAVKEALGADDCLSEDSWMAKKRRARSSFSTRLISDQKSKDINVEHSGGKKVRFVEQDDDDDDGCSSIGRPSTYSFITQSDDTIDSIKDLPNPSFLAQVSEVGGFGGQFHGLPTSEQAERAKMFHVEKVPVYMGQALHLNNLILHKDIHVCPEFGTTEYGPETAPADSEIGRCISHGNERIFEAAEMIRSPAEEILRVEAHRECAAARLSGEVVGVHRYFQGSLTVEEYHERKMCICWQLCECSKLCTRFADMICPCASKIETNCH